MGYSGYTQYLCAKGHRDSLDCSSKTLKFCTECHRKITWSNSVDTTNGSFCESTTSPLGEEELMCVGCQNCDAGRIDGYVELEMTHPAKEEGCGCCGHVQVVESARFKPPSK